MALLGLAGSISLLAGWRLYLCVFATGLAMRTGWIALPEQAASLAVLANPWVIGAAAVGLVAEFFADKIPWLDSLWDGVHTLVRPVGGALLAMAIVDPHDPAWQIASLLLGGSAALLTHGAKASTRAVINTSPEPVTNVSASLIEDAATGSLLLLAFANPVMAVIVALFLVCVAIALLLLMRRIWRRLRASLRGNAGFVPKPTPDNGSNTNT